MTRTHPLLRNVLASLPIAVLIALAFVLSVYYFTDRVAGRLRVGRG